MNRIIKFRGKRNDNGEWVYGFYCNIQNKENYILTPCVLGLAWIEVNPNTVGQFTGLTDKNGKEIYEGDVIRMALIANENVGLIFRISYMHGCFVALDEEECSDIVMNEYTVEVIGNIHDNPSLLK